jgi:hypothetical protein
MVPEYLDDNGNVPAVGTYWQANNVKPHLGIPLATTEEIVRLQSGAAGSTTVGNWFLEGFSSVAANVAPSSAQQSMILHRFGSPSDVRYDEGNPVLPANPRVQEPAVANGIRTVRPYAARAPFGPGLTAATAERDYPFTWAMAVQRPLVDEPGAEYAVAGQPWPPAGTFPWTSRRENRVTFQGISVYRKPGLDAPYTFGGTVRYLCFHKRNLSRPYQAIEGCFYEGSRRVTLSWPSNGTTPAPFGPRVKRGTWLCEMTITGGRVSGFYNDGAAGTRREQYRQSMNFYQVVDVEDPVVIGSRIYQMVNIDRAVSDANGRTYNSSNVTSNLNADVRRAPIALNASPDSPQDNHPCETPGSPRLAPSTWWPILDGDISGASPTKRIMYYPVIIFDGLEHVF